MSGVASDGAATRRFKLAALRIERRREAGSVLRQLPVMGFMWMSMAADPGRASHDSSHRLANSAMEGIVGALRIAPGPAGATIPLPATPRQNGTERKSG